MTPPCLRYIHTFKSHSIEQVDQVEELKRLCRLEDAAEAHHPEGGADHLGSVSGLPPSTFQPITGDANQACLVGFPEV